MTDSEDMDIDNVLLVTSRGHQTGKETPQDLASFSNPDPTDQDFLNSPRARRARVPPAAPATSVAPVSPAKAKENNLRLILEAALPTGTVVSNETLDRLSHAFIALIDKTSEAAARKAVSRTATRTAAAKSSPSRRITSAAARAPAPTKSVGAVKTSSRGRPPRVQKGTASRGKKQKEESESEEEEDEEYEVESIISHRIRDGNLQFRIKWKGFPINKSTWEEKSALDGCQELLKEYLKKENLSL
ncbi:hypothetical protein BGZ80_007201 [Entomortierella chlamydospora]|uniref:Chromo domain-containing protein n=1 Tax=Entomortierella chlamydospora TaxID=101097 RepID=A0A9P6MFR1_9FUNG|nr:hypothetical protein BGZ80_007201 [Entomortierella chlamydospora]